MLADYEKTTFICTTQQLNDYSLPLIPTPPLIMAVNIGEAVGCLLPSNSPCHDLCPGCLYADPSEEDRYDSYGKALQQCK